MFVQWMRNPPRAAINRQRELVALALVILFLFPVISVTDDLFMALNPAETDYCQRKGDVSAGSHAYSNAAQYCILPASVNFNPSLVIFAESINTQAPLALIPAINSIQNRPPPLT
jgi:hypothetical protein